jgi:hypothetical protein
LIAENAVRFLSAPDADFGRFGPMEHERERMNKTKVTGVLSGECREVLEARVGIEPTHKGFADLSLTTWVPRLDTSKLSCSARKIQCSPHGWRSPRSGIGRQRLSRNSDLARLRQTPRVGCVLKLRYCVLKKAGQPQSGMRSALRVLQFLPDTEKSFCVT